MFRQWLHTTLSEMYPGARFDVLVPPDAKMGDYSTNIALVAKKNAQEVCDALIAKGGEMIERCQVAGPGFVNIFLKDEYLRGQLGKNEIPQENKGKTVMVEYTDPNPFKQFHIGHLMTNVIGESIARVYEATGAKVLRVNYQGDVGIHVACSIWGMMQLEADMPDEDVALADRAAFLGRTYALGATAYKEDPEAKAQIDALNKQIYEKSDPNINDLYDAGRKWSLDYFETIYAKLGTTFAHYFFESQSGPAGLEIVRSHPEIFTASNGATVFAGEQYGLHTRVFINSLGLPTYEAKELGVNKEKFDTYHPDLSLIVTANEINDYFRVLLKVMELTLPEVAAKTKHVGHGMLRLLTGKMSSRTGDVITAEHLIEEVKKVASEKINVDDERVVMAAIRYPILKQGIGKDIIFDFETSVSVTGDSGPYLQYTYARLANIVAKAGDVKGAPSPLTHPVERAMMRHLLDFGHAVAQCVELSALNGLALHLYQLATLANRYYEEVHINADEDASRKAARLELISAVMAQMKKGLALLGIQTLERI